MIAAGLFSIYVNGVSVLSLNTTNTGFTSTPFLAAGGTGTSGYTLDGNIHKFAAYDRIVTAQERIEISAWLETEV